MVGLHEVSYLNRMGHSLSRMLIKNSSILCDQLPVAPFTCQDTRVPKEDRELTPTRQDLAVLEPITGESTEYLKNTGTPVSVPAGEHELRALKQEITVGIKFLLGQLCSKLKDWILLLLGR